MCRFIVLDIRIYVDFDIYFYIDLENVMLEFSRVLGIDVIFRVFIFIILFTFL